jgi:ribosomal protein S18 acetylase RimI-like enzyme
MLANKQISLRPGTPEDSDFLYDLHRAAMQQYVAQTWDWDEAWQRNYFQQHINPAECQIITFQGKDVGFLSASGQETEVFLRFIEVLPEYQNQGVGTAVIKSILEEAHHTGQPVGLQVLKVNPARSLYERLGFLTTGETATHYMMRATPEQQTGPNKPHAADAKSAAADTKGVRPGPHGRPWN